MDELDKKLFNDLSEKIGVPIRCEYIIRNALKNEELTKRKKIEIIVIKVARVFGVLLLTAGTAFASTKIYENIWKTPEKIENFYGAHGEWYSNDINVNEKKAITEDEAREKFNEILNKFGYKNETIKSIELIDNPSDDGLFYRATTQNEFLLDLDAKNTENFKLFTNIAYKNIGEYRGTQKEIENEVNNICKKYGYDLSKYNSKEVSFNISESVYDKNIYENAPEYANIWQIKYNKEYNGVVNKYEELTIGIIPEINEIYYFIYTNKSPENIDIVVNEQQAKNIALLKEKELNIGYNIKNVETKMDIVKMNGYAYLRENDFKKYYEQRFTERYPVDKLEYYRVEERIRQVWRVKLEFETPKEDRKSVV